VLSPAATISGSMEIPTHLSLSRLDQSALASLSDANGTRRDRVPGTPAKEE